MTTLDLFQPGSSALDDVWVAIDLETTGLSPSDDEIIEVGAVKFQGDTDIDELQSFVNPHRQLGGFVKMLTGIDQSEVDAAPDFSDLAPDLGRFVGDAPVVGHNVAFDLRFLTVNGLQLANPRCDTWDMAYVMLPGAREYSLGRLAASLGIDHPRPHRAQDDAAVTRDLFRALVERALDLDVFLLAEMEQLAARSPWVLGYLLRSLTAKKIAEQIHAPQQDEVNGGGVAPGRLLAGGLDLNELKLRLRRPRKPRVGRTGLGTDADYVASLLREGGPLSDALPGFEERAEQIEMARRVADVVNNGGRLMVEAGTGVGKSLAYLIPAALYALKHEKRVVVSTNTINLQDQLMAKDMPGLVAALDKARPGLGGQLRYCQLKGRSNFVCLRRWMLLRGAESLTEEDARLMSKLAVWGRETSTGDRSELNLGNRNAAQPWSRVSADGAPGCIGVNGTCFLRSARERAAGAHIVVVNHALLLSNLMAGGTLIPEFDVLIVDEAHHLEEEATKHFGFELGQAYIDDYLQSLTGDRGLLGQAAVALRGSSTGAGRRATLDEVTTRVLGVLPKLRDSAAATFAALEEIIVVHNGLAEGEIEARVTAATRSQPGWAHLEVLWEGLDAVLGELRGEMGALNTAMEGLEEAGITNYEGIVMEAANRQQVVSDLRQRLEQFIPHPRPDGIYWVSRRRRGELTLHAAPLSVGEQLSEHLFDTTETVVLTSATLATGGEFRHMRERTGFEEPEELLLGSPFDYPNAAMLCIPEDMPEPDQWAYPPAVEQAITDAAVAADGRTMALFTSHAALQAAASGVRSNLRAQGITVLAQGIDGTPHQLVRRLIDEPRSVILGTSSFWEGVDLAGDVLKVLLLARLPFSVPTAPVFAARSEQFENPFEEYALPQAILRARQGFGRLIRTKTDRGAVVLLDRRVLSRRYGKQFLDSLPPTNRQTFKLRELGDRIRAWL